MTDLKTKSLYKEAIEEFYTEMKLYLDERVFESLIVPEQIHIFKVEWTDRHGTSQINTAYRVQHSQILGPYKGGLRFDPTVDLDSIKYLAFEQTLKNSLSMLTLGGAKGGSDFDPRNKTAAEIKNFSQAFISVSHNIFGKDKDIPAGDLGVGEKEISYMLQQYRKIHGEYTGVFTGKPLSLGGLQGRKEATGYGLIYILESLLKDISKDLINQKIIISGTGNVAIHAAEKAVEKQALVVAMSDRSGHIFDKEGLDIELVKNRVYLEGLSLKEAFPDLHRKGNPYQYAADIVLPCATQNELNADDLIKLKEKGALIIAEGANGPLTRDAMSILKDLNLYFLPGKAANMGGVFASQLEMQQNAQMKQFSFASVDYELKKHMKRIYRALKETSYELNQPYNFILSSDYLAYKRLEEAYNLHMT